MAGRYLNVLVHFVWSTSGRESWITPDWSDRLYGYIGGVLRHDNVTLIHAGGTSNHIHLLASLPSTISLAELVNSAKANSSRWIHDEFQQLSRFAWQKGYGAFSVSKSAEMRVVEYIRNQEEHHKKLSFEEEFREFLEKHEVHYDEKFLLD